MIKNKVFFFFAVENTINHTTPAVSFLTVPTAGHAAGQFRGNESDLRSDHAIGRPRYGVSPARRFRTIRFPPSCWIRWPRPSSRTIRRPIATGN